MRQFTINKILASAPGVLALFSVLLLAACSRDDADEVSKGESTADTPEALVAVNGSPITAEELSLAADRTFGDAAALYMNEELENKLLKSLISSRAISQAALKEMSTGELHNLELKTRAYKEELLVKYYLEEYAQPEAVTNEMVKDYYRNNQEKFGGGNIKQFEYIQVRIPEGGDLAEAVEPLNKLKEQADWKSEARKLEELNPDWRVDYKNAAMEAGSVQKPLNDMLASLQPGEVAPLKIQKQSCTLLRLNSEKALPVKPLSEVSAEIRKMLSPIQLKKAVKYISDKALAEADIEYMEMKPE